MSKYEPLWNYIDGNGNDEIKLTFDKIKNILGFEVDHSFLNYKNELLKYGYKLKKISLKEKYISFIRNWD